MSEEKPDLCLPDFFVLICLKTWSGEWCLILEKLALLHKVWIFCKNRIFTFIFKDFYRSMKVENIFVSVVFEIEIMQISTQNHSCFILSVCKMLKFFFVFVNTEKTNLPCGPYAIINLLQNCICSKKFHIIFFRAYVSRKLTKRLTQNLSFSKSLRKSRA